ncbi:MAG: hypothetical protein ACT4NY_00805 [Pseudonocardiales bacterium]
MPDSTHDFETRLATVERKVARLHDQATLTSSDVAAASVARVDANAARMLGAGADHDVSEVRAELRAHTQALNALRETQLEQARAIASLEQKMTEGFATLATGMAQITALLTNLDK